MRKRRDEDDYTLDDDYDGRPGGRGMSPEYIRKYDPDLHLEQTNRLEQANEMELLAAEQEMAEAARRMEELREEASGRVQFWPQVGKFVIPTENTFAAHLQLVESERGVEFNPAKHLFDRILVASANRPDLFDPSHPQFLRYAALRKNLAVLRNDIEGIYMDDGDFGPGDEKYLPLLAGVAQETGEAIGNEGRLLPRLFGPHLNVDLLNMEGDGAAYAYRFLMKRQRTPGTTLGSIVSDVLRMSGMRDREWGLPDIRETPFSEEGLGALPPPDVLCMTHGQMLQYCRNQHEPVAVAPAGDAREQAAEAVEAMGDATRTESIRHGIIILRWLKDLKFNDKSIKEVLEAGEPQDREELRGIVAHVVQLYEGLMSAMIARNPALAQSEKVQSAGHASKTLQHSISLLAALEKPVSLAQTQQISTDVTQQPDRWNELKDQTVDRLMQTLKGGLEDAFGALEQQQQDQERQNEEAVEQAAESLIASDLLRRKRKKVQKKKKSAQVNAFNQRRSARDLNGDGVADRFQGINIDHPINVPVTADGKFRDLKLQDQEALLAIGKALAKTGEAVRAPVTDGKDVKSGGGPLGISVADVGANDPIAPDSQDVATRIIQQRERELSSGKKLI